MARTKPSNSSPENVVRWRQELERARLNMDERQISLALANLGYALFVVKKYQSGLEHFNESLELAKRFNSPTFHAQVLGLKMLAYQEIGRLPDALLTAAEIFDLAEAGGEVGLMCDALCSQGQILLESGEQTISFEKLLKAREIAQELNDRHRLMNILGALGHGCLVTAMIDRSEIYFDEALTLAREFSDRRAECGFLGNIGMVLSWQKQPQAAVQAFEQILLIAQEMGDVEAEINSLHQLVRLYCELQNDDQVLNYAQRGLEVSSPNEKEIRLKFLEALIMAYYRLNHIEDAHRSTIEAIALAQVGRDRNKEVDLLLSLGESYLSQGEYAPALANYQLALEGAKQLERLKDEAYLTGRIGLVFAEQGRLGEATLYHHKAVELAREREIPELEGEQLSMLAMAYLEQGDLPQAQSFCNTAINIFSNNGLETEMEKAQHLLDRINAELATTVPVSVMV